MIRGHIRFAGIQEATRRKYKLAIWRFFNWLDASEWEFPSTQAEIDYAAGEFINFLYQEERPFDWASTFITAFKRFCPAHKRALGTASLYVKNWSKTLVRVSAMPYTADMVQSMAVLLHLEGKSDLAVLCLVAFAGLFRLAELFNLRVKYVEFLADDYCLVSLTTTKSRRGAETVILRDETTVLLLKVLVRNRPSSARVFNCTYGQLNAFLRRYAVMVGLSRRRFTGHGFRRGGATHVFKALRSYDEAQRLGRWQDQATCKLYIDEAVADKLSLSLPAAGQQIARDGARSFPQVARQLIAKLFNKARRS